MAWVVLEGTEHELVGSLKAKPGLRRYLRRTGGGLLRIDHAAIRREQHLDGKWLLRTSDLTLTPDDLAATGDTWRNTRHELDRMALVTLATTHGRVAQRSALTTGHKTIFAALGLPEPARYFDFTTTGDWPAPQRPTAAACSNTTLTG